MSILLNKIALFLKALQMYALIIHKTSICPKIYDSPFHKLLIISKYFARFFQTCENNTENEDFILLGIRMFWAPPDRKSRDQALSACPAERTAWSDGGPRSLPSRLLLRASRDQLPPVAALPIPCAEKMYSYVSDSTPRRFVYVSSDAMCLPVRYMCVHPASPKRNQI